jgi:glucokinase
LKGAEPSSLRALSSVTARDVSIAAAAGDALAGRIWDETTAILGTAVATILDVFNPELVVLGGGVTRAGAQFLDPVRNAALAEALGPARRSAEVVLAERGDELGVVAAAAVAFERLLGLDGPAGNDGTLHAGPQALAREVAHG